MILTNHSCSYENNAQKSVEIQKHFEKISLRTINNARGTFHEDDVRLLRMVSPIFFREKFFQEFKFSGKQIQNKKKKEYVLSKNIININKITERVLIGTIILYPNLLKKVIDKFKLLNFTQEKFNKIKDLTVDFFNKKKTIENLNIRTTLIKSEYKRIVLEIIDNSILLHAPFLKNKSNIDLILKGWNEYLKEYLEKKDTNMMKKEADKLLIKLDEENYTKFKKYNLNIEKK